MIIRDYFQRLQELLSSFDSISSQTRYETSDLDTSAKARKQAYKAQDKEAKKRMKMNDQSGVDVQFYCISVMFIANQYDKYRDICANTIGDQYSSSGFAK